MYFDTLHARSSSYLPCSLQNTYYMIMAAKVLITMKHNYSSQLAACIDNLLGSIYLLIFWFYDEKKPYLWHAGDEVQ